MARRATARMILGLIPRFLPLVFILILTGCETDRDVSMESQFRRGYIRGQIYRLKSDCGIYNFGSCQPCELYRLNDPMIGRFSSSMTDLIPRGSRFRVDRLVHVTISAPIQGESFVRVFVSVLDHPGACSDVGLVARISDRQVVIIAPGGWPTVIGLPDPDYMVLEEKTDIR